MRVLYGNGATECPDVLLVDDRGAIRAFGSGRELTLAWKDGSRKLLVPADVPIVTAVNADRSFLKPGEYVYLNAETGSDGRMTAIGRIQVSKDGVRPPQ